MKDQPLITVVIPTYNRSDVLRRTIKSVLKQTYKNFELLIVDDGSTDDTEEFLQDNFLHNSRINLVKRPEDRPKGANACRNIGFEKAEGKFIALLDSDDKWEPCHLSSCISIAQSCDGFKGCYSGAIIKKINANKKRKSRKLKPEETHLDFLLTDGFAPTPSLFMDKSAALNVKFDENLQRHQDWDFFIRFGQKYSWVFNDQINVSIHWPNDNVTRKIDFASCIAFYQKYRNQISHKETAVKYLRSMYNIAVMQKEDEALKFYKKELEKYGKGNDLALKFPQCYRVYRLFKNKLRT